MNEYDGYGYEEAEDMGTRLSRSIRTCTATVKHLSVPSWLVPGTSDFKKLVVRCGSPDVLARQEAFIAGFTDATGLHWCGQCLFRERCMSEGSRFGFPDMHALYPLPETREVCGHDGWLAVLKSCNTVLPGALYLVLRRMPSAR